MKGCIHIKVPKGDTILLESRESPVSELDKMTGKNRCNEENIGSGVLGEV